MAAINDFFHATKTAAPDNDVEVRYQSRDNSPEHIQELECYASIIRQVLSFPCYDVVVSLKGEGEDVAAPKSKNGGK